MKKAADMIERRYHMLRPGQIVRLREECPAAVAFLDNAALAVFGGADARHTAELAGKKVFVAVA